jgi:homoserine O-succinyltransferase/O-acetyltransferase
MPILVDKGPSRCRIYPGENYFDEISHLRHHQTGCEWIEIGLLNNMPDAALDQTELQFLELLSSAAEDRWVHLRFFSLPDLPRSARGRQQLAGYSDIGDLWKADLDGLIVTGTEPKATDLIDEPYWRVFSELVDWAEYNTISTIWSCLASHAAVLYLDGIRRTPLGEKCFGLFDCEVVSAHPLTAKLPSTFCTPHARYNDLQEDELSSRGYQVLTLSREAGVDMFVRQQQQSLFLFCQGHPEYDSRSLLNEYRRDVGRFLKGERETYPTMPLGYFDGPTTEAMSAFRCQACLERSDALMETFPMAPAASTLVNSWFPWSVGIYRNWLSYILAQKIRHLSPPRYVASLRLGRAFVPT